MSMFTSYFIFKDFYIGGERNLHLRIENVKNAKVKIIQKYYSGTKEVWAPSRYANEETHAVDPSKKVHYFNLITRILQFDCVLPAQC